MTTTVKPLGYMPQLDGLRGLAIIFVMTVHFGLGSLLPSEHFSLGFRGVGLSIFFILSGFLIMETLQNTRQRLADQTIDVGKETALFLLNKAMRIYPAYFLLLLLVTALNFHDFQEVALWHYIFVANMDFARYTDISTSYALAHAPTAHLWSISVQEQLYFLLPLLVFSLKGKKLLVAVALSIILAPIWRMYWIFFDDSSTTIRHLFTLPSLLDTLMSGALLSLYRRNYYGIQDLMSQYVSIVITAAAIFSAAILALKASGVGSRFTTLLFDPFLALTLCYVVLNATTNQQNILGRFLNLKSLRFLGRISFGLYLYHALAPHIASAIFSGIGLTPDKLFLHWVLTYIAISIVMAWCSWQFFEKPILKFRSRFIRNIRSKKASPAEQAAPQGNI